MHQNVNQKSRPLKCEKWLKRKKNNLKQFYKSKEYLQVVNVVFKKNFLVCVYQMKINIILCNIKGMLLKLSITIRN